MQSLAANLRPTPRDAGSAFQLHHVRVVEARSISASFVRVTVTGPDLDRAAHTGWDQRIKLILPLPRIGVSSFPTTDSWYADWRALPDDLRNPIRTYTLRAVRPDEHTLDIDVARHGPIGPAGAWIEEVQAGSELMVMLPNAEYPGDPGGIDFHLPRGCETVLLGGDATATPAIASILECLPDDVRGEVVIELPHASDLALLPTHPGLRITAHVTRGPHGDALRQAVPLAARSLLQSTQASCNTPLEEIDVDVDPLWEVPDQGGGASRYAWLAGEAGVIKDLRRHLVLDLGWDRADVAFMGYWRRGLTEDG